jgi:hypothetical protein
MTFFVVSLLFNVFVSMVYISPDAGYEVFTLLKIKVEFFWVLRPCSVVVGYQRFRGPCFTLQLEATGSSETSASYYSIARRNNPEEFDLNLHRR